jgi:hydrophobic/amphiphilic exporter-1 (mainly G- bacteria), HAE1 family
LVLLLVAVFAITYFIPFKKVEIVEQQEEDRSSFEIGVEVSNEYSFEDLAVYFRDAEKLLEEKKEEYGLRGYFVFHGRRGGRVEGWFERDKPGKFSSKEVAEKIAKAMPVKPGIKLHYGRENQAEEAKGRETFVMRIEGDEAAMVDEVATRLETLVMGTEGVLGIRRGEDPSPSEMALVVNRDRATMSSVSPEVIAGLVGYALRGNSLPKFNYEGREIPVRIRFQEEDRQSLADLSNFQIPVEGGGSIPLSALTTARILNTPQHIFRWNKRISRTLTIELIKEGAKETRDRLSAMQRDLTLPEGVSFSQSRVMTMDEEIANMLFAAQLSVIFIYLLMGFLFESFILPLSIILTIPLGAIGVSWTHYLTGKDLDFLGVVGAILLIGVVVNNGIVLLDYVTRLRAEGMERTKALLTASDRRFRPIAMTALTTIIGMIPLTFAKPNEIGLSYKSFGLTLIGGMTTATVLTMLVVPVFYTFFDDARLAFARIVRRALAGGKKAPLPGEALSAGTPV